MAERSTSLITPADIMATGATLSSKKDPQSQVWQESAVRAATLANQPSFQTAVRAFIQNPLDADTATWEAIEATAQGVVLDSGELDGAIKAVRKALQQKRS